MEMRCLPPNSSLGWFQSFFCGSIVLRGFRELPSCPGYLVGIESSLRRLLIC